MTIKRRFFSLLVVSNQVWPVCASCSVCARDPSPGVIPIHLREVQLEEGGRTGEAGPGAWEQPIWLAVPSLNPARIEGIRALARVLYLPDG